MWINNNIKEIIEMSKQYSIEKVENGYIINFKCQSTYCLKTKIFHTLEEVFNDILYYYESRSKTMGNKNYGYVKILSNKN